MESVVLRAGEGEALFDGRIVIKADFEQLTITESLYPVGRDEIALIEFDLSPEFDGPPPHAHDDHVDSFYVLDGEADFLVGDEWMRLGAGSFVAAPIGVVHAFTNRGPGRARLLNIHAPSTGFHERLDR